MIFARKIMQIPDFIIFARKINKIPEFYMIFCPKMSEFYIIIARKNLPELGEGHVPPAPRLLLLWLPATDPSLLLVYLDYRTLPTQDTSVPPTQVP